MNWKSIISKAMKHAVGVDDNGWFQYRNEHRQVSNMGFRRLKEADRFEIEVGGYLWNTQVDNDERTVMNGVWQYIDDAISQYAEFDGYNTYSKTAEGDPKPFGSLLVDISSEKVSSRQLYHIDANDDLIMIVLHISDKSPGTHYFKGSRKPSAIEIADSWEVPPDDVHDFASLIHNAPTLRHDASALLLTPQTVQSQETRTSDNVPAGTIRVCQGGAVHAGPDRGDQGVRVMWFTTFAKSGKELYDPNGTWGQFRLLGNLCRDVWRDANRRQRCLLIEHFNTMIRQCIDMGINGQTIRNTIKIDLAPVSRTLMYIALLYTERLTVDLDWVQNWDFEMMFPYTEDEDEYTSDDFVRFFDGEMLDKWRKNKFNAGTTILCHLFQMADTFGIVLVFRQLCGPWHEYVQEATGGSREIMVTVTDQSRPESTISLQEANGQSWGWSIQADKSCIKDTSIVNNAVQILFDGGITEERMTNGLLFGSTSAPSRVLHDRGILTVDDSDKEDDQTRPTVSIAWGAVAAPWPVCCDHTQFHLSCLLNEQVKLLPRLSGNPDCSKRVKQPWGQPTGKCTCGQKPGISTFDVSDTIQADTIQSADNYITTLARDKTKNVGGSMIHCDGAYVAGGILLQGCKTVTVIDRSSTADVVRISGGRLRLWATAR